jgi:hypothetical protein
MNIILTALVGGVVFLVGGIVGAVWVHRRGALPFVRRPEQWAISMYEGETPTDLTPLASVRHPVLTAADVTDVEADFVADPFLFHRDGRWYLFFEVVNARTRAGEIGLATSADGHEWTYERVVLAEPFHLSYPQVFAVDDTVYMLPESQQAAGIRLYEATSFPYEWTPVATLLHGAYHDPTIVRYGERWWLFCSEWHHTLRLFSSEVLEGPWQEHPASPIVKNDERYARPAGRVVPYDGGLIRFAQDCSQFYGQHVHAFRITELSADSYDEQLLQASVLTGSGTGWNALRMHHLDAHRMGEDRWLAAVDGDAGQKLRFNWRDL